MEKYFENSAIDAATLAEVADCIMQTKLPAKPETFVARILCDADIYHSGTEYFLLTNELVKKEIELRNNIELKNWKKISLSFLGTQHFFTSYCRDLLEEGKRKNIYLLQISINE